MYSKINDLPLTSSRRYFFTVLTDYYRQNIQVVYKLFTFAL